MKTSDKGEREEKSFLVFKIQLVINDSDVW